MTFAIFTLVQHREKDGKYYGYAPYIREMNIWTKYVDDVIVVAPKSTLNGAPSWSIATGVSC